MPKREIPEKEATTKDVIFYDGNCPICSAEMKKLKDCADDALVLQNIHEIKEDKNLPPKEALMQRLHLKTASGSWLTGIEANIQAWQHTRYGPFWRILTLPVLRQVSEWAYELWLRRRNRRP